MAKCIAGAVRALSRALAAQAGFAGGSAQCNTRRQTLVGIKAGVARPEAGQGAASAGDKSLAQETEEFMGWDEMIQGGVAPRWHRMSAGQGACLGVASTELGGFSGQEVALTVIDRNWLPSRTRACLK